MSSVRSAAATANSRHPLLNNCNSKADRPPVHSQRNSSERHGTSADPLSFPTLDFIGLSGDAGSSNGCNIATSKYEVVMPDGLWWYEERIQTTIF